MNGSRFAPMVSALSCVLLTTVTSASTLIWFGNSFSDAGRVWSLVPAMVNCHSCGISETMSITETASIIPSCMLPCQESSGAFATIDSGHFNYIVAQDNIANFIVWDLVYYGGGTNSTAAATDLTSWATHAKSAGSKLVIEEMWLRVGTTEQTQQWQDSADEWYDSIARATGSLLSPNGHAWFDAYQKNKNLEFIDPAWNDAMHPGTFGAYLNACCFFATLTGVSPVGHSIRSVAFGDTVTLPDSQALFAQQEAWAAYQYFKAVTPVRVSPAPAAEGSLHQEVSATLHDRRIVVTGAGMRAVRLLGLNGTCVAVAKPSAGSAATVDLPGGRANGLYLVAVATDTGTRTLLVKVR